MRKAYILLLLLLATAGCNNEQQHSREHEIMDSFMRLSDRVDNRFAEENIYSVVYDYIKQRRADNPQLAAAADSVFYVTCNADTFINGLKNALLQKDSAMESLTVMEQVLTPEVQQQVFARVGYAMYVCKQYATSERDKNKVDSILKNIAASEHLPRHEPVFDKRMPTVVAMALLSSLRNKCDDAALVVLKGMRYDMKHNRQH